MLLEYRYKDNLKFGIRLYLSNDKVSPKLALSLGNNIFEYDIKNLFQEQ